MYIITWLQKVIEKHFILSNHVLLNFYGKSLHVNTLGQDLGKLFCKGKYFRLLGTYNFCHSYSSPIISENIQRQYVKE